MPDLQGYFLERPRELISFGGTSIGIGFAVMRFGLLGNVGMGAQAFPGWWIWWIPESLLGYVPAIAVAGIGAWLGRIGRDYQRFLD